MLLGVLSGVGDVSPAISPQRLSVSPIKFLYILFCISYGPQDGKLYGRGGADDGYSVFGAIAAIRAVRAQNQPHVRCVIMIEACEVRVACVYICVRSCVWLCWCVSVSECE